MGLDMYLNKKIYITSKDNITLNINGVEIKQEIDIITLNIMYWRKSNSVHNWFVENIQGGTDDCGEYYVSIEKLEKLLEDCEEDVKYLKSLTIDIKWLTNDNGTQFYIKGFENLDENELNLRTVSGFFFGPTGYDENYLRDLERTIIELKKILDNEKSNPEISSSIYYQASW